jgi:pyrimidine-nucleoside phosphorylase
MRAVDLIAKKRDGGSLTSEEIRWLIQGYTDDSIADYQMAAWAMAVLLRGMDGRETADLTMAMAESGDMLDLHDIAPLTVDKHSTGGIGDKTTLLLAPMVASVGLPVAKMSGRGLGFSGGTIDKLESIPGMRLELDNEEFRRSVREVGLVVAAQTGDLAPADKKLYALRDVTATVESIPLIAASIMSKKLAAGADCIVLDVKCGEGAFMRTLDDARKLARTMVGIGQRNGRKVAAVISTMAQPLGYGVGNTLEVREAVAALRGAGPRDLVELCITLGAQLLILAGRTDDQQVARATLQEALSSGKAWEKFIQMIKNQGGDVSLLEQDALPEAPVIVPVPAPKSGYVNAIEGQELGHSLNSLGGGRMRKGDTIDPSVGLILQAKVGHKVKQGDPLLHVHAASQEAANSVIERLQAAYTIGEQAIQPPALVLDIIHEE